MTDDPRWKRPCSLMGCPREWKRRPHHHHYSYGHLTTFPCACPNRAEPGTQIDDRKVER